MNKLRNAISWFKNNSNLVYLDSAATSLKPDFVLKGMSDYALFDGTNPHNSDSLFAFKALTVMKDTKAKIAKLLNCDADELAFTPGATFSLNMIADSLANFLKSGDEIILTNAEHASNLLPWFKLRDEKKIVIKFAKILLNYIDLENHPILKLITSKTKIISFANETNLLGNIIDAQKLSIMIKKINPNIIVCVDSTQYVAHHKLDLKNSKIDFAVGSAHKMLGPSGIGFLYINKKLIENLKPTIMGGGMNFEIRKSFYTLMAGISKFEAGTPNIMGIYGWNKALSWYLENDLNQESLRVYQLKSILEKKLSEIKNVRILNRQIHSFILLFSYDNIFSQDIASYLGNNGVIVRSGLSCAKLADEIINIPHAIRVSFHFYTNESDILKLVDLLKKYKRGDELDGII